MMFDAREAPKAGNSFLFFIFNKILAEFTPETRFYFAIKLFKLVSIAAFRTTSLEDNRSRACQAIEITTLCNIKVYGFKRNG